MHPESERNLGMRSVANVQVKEKPILRKLHVAEEQRGGLKDLEKKDCKRIEVTQRMEPAFEWSRQRASDL